MLIDRIRVLEKKRSVFLFTDESFFLLSLSLSFVVFSIPLGIGLIWKSIDQMRKILRIF